MKKQKTNKVKTVVYLIHFILIDIWARNGVLHIFWGGSDKWKTKNKDAKGHVDLFRIDEGDISHYVCMTDCSSPKTRKNVNLTIGLTFVNVAIIVLELKKG